MNKLYLVRHGDYTHKDGSLTKKGRAQSRAIGEFLAERKDRQKYAIIYSPYPRTKETAEIIRGYVDEDIFLESESIREVEKGEELEEIKDRSLSTFAIATTYIGRDVIIVSHRYIIQQMLGPVLGHDPKVFNIQKGQVYELTITGPGKARYEDRWGGK